MKSNDLRKLHQRYGSELAGTLSPNMQQDLKIGLESITEINSKADAECFLHLLALLREAEVQSISGLGRDAMSTITGAFSGGDEGVYSADSNLMNARFIFELVQNVDDCFYEDPSKCTLDIRFGVKSDTIILEYNEVGFQPENILAITGLGNSTKNHRKAKSIRDESALDQSDFQEIGEKGIGFKSIFGLAKSVSISSRYFFFSINRDRFFVPIVEDYSSKTFVNGTRLELSLDTGMVAELYNYLKSKYDNLHAVINENPILFLNKLTEIRYFRSQTDYFGFRVSRSAKKQENDETTIEYFSSNHANDKKIEAYRFIHPVEYSIGECKSRYGEHEDKSRTHQIIVIAPKHPQLISEGRIYSFFATEEKVHAPFIIHAPFKLSSGRTRIDSQSQGIESTNLWFLRTKRETIAAIQSVYEQLAQIQGNQIIHYIPISNLVQASCALYDAKLSRANILTWDIFPTVNGEYLPMKDVCIINYEGDNDQIVEIHSLLGIPQKLMLINNADLKAVKSLGIKMYDSLSDKLLCLACYSSEKTNTCLKYISDYTPRFSLQPISTKRTFRLSCSQIQAFAPYPLICAWLNKHTYDYLFHKRGTPIVISDDCHCTSIDNIRAFCNEYGTAINSRFVDYVTQVKYVSWNYASTVVTFNIVFGQNMLEDFAEIYRIWTPKDKFFYPFLRMEAVSEEINLLCAKGFEISDYEFLTLLQGHRRNEKNLLKTEYKGILDLVEKAGTSIERFLPELLQNIDDCNYTEEPSVSFRLIRHGQALRVHVAYNETGFTRNQVRAITAIGDSTKKQLLAQHTTGEKGVGFKSVFSVCSNVSILSGNFSFSLSAETPTVPERIEKVSTHPGTEIILTVKPIFEKYIHELFSEKATWIKYLLCLKQIHSVEVNGTIIRIEDSESGRTATIGKDRYEYLRYEHPITVENLQALNHRLKSKEVDENQVITYLVPQFEYSGNYIVYSTLPTLEQVNIPILIDMPVSLDTARERLQDDAWNREIVHQMLEGLLGVYHKLKRIYNAELPKFFPYFGKVLDHAFGHSSTLLDAIATQNYFKVYAKNQYVSLHAGVFSKDFEYELFEKFPLCNKQPLALLERKEEPYDIIRSLFPTHVKERTSSNICDMIDIAINSYGEQAFINQLRNSTFRDKLYVFLSETPDRNRTKAISIKKWPIIPIVLHNETFYSTYSEDIYAQGSDSPTIASEKYKLLDDRIMPAETFNIIFGYINGSYAPIRVFSRDIIIAEFFYEIKRILSIVDLRLRANSILKLYNAETELFQETVKTRNDFPAANMVFESRDGTLRLLHECFISDSTKNQGCLEQVIVSEKFRKLAMLLNVKNLKSINDFSQIPFEIRRKELQELKKCSQLPKKVELFDSIYLSPNKSRELRAGDGYFDLYELISDATKRQINPSTSEINLDAGLIQRHTEAINEISVYKYPITFSCKFKLLEFEKDAILSEIENELRLRKENAKIISIIELLKDCHYAALGTKEPCMVRLKARNMLIVDQNITADYEIIEILKAYFLRYFSTEISVNRSISPYTRRGLENISTIVSSAEDVAGALRLFGPINLSSVDEIKDFLCKPLFYNGITYGGYAKTCPLCGARIDTELTGMRIFKTKSEGWTVTLLSCCNCYENLRYASEIKIDTAKLREGILHMLCNINGHTWLVENVTIRLGHRILLASQNKDSN